MPSIWSTMYHMQNASFCKSLSQQCQVASKSFTQKRVHVLDQEDSFSVADDEPQVYINAIQVHGISESSWLSTVSTEIGKITFKLDTGAEASVLPLKINKHLSNKPAIKHKQQ